MAKDSEERPVSLDKANSPRSTSIAEDLEAMKGLRGNVVSTIRQILHVAQEEGLLDDIESELQSDPEALKSFQAFEKSTDGQKENDMVQRTLDMFSNYVLTMQIDPSLHRDSADFYDFPHERIRPVLLRRAGKSTPSQLIKTYRWHQLSEFAFASDGKSPGFKLVFSDDEYKPTDKERKSISEFEDIFAKRFFFVPNVNRPSLAKFLCYAYNDFFDLDKIAIEIVRQTASTSKKWNYRGKPLSMTLADAGTIHHIVPRMYDDRRVDLWRWDRKEMDRVRDRLGIHYEYVDDNRYIQVDRDGVKRAAYTENRMILSHAFGETDMMEQFQGFGIVEKSLNILRYIIDSITYNYTRRSAGTMPKGMVVVQGATEDGFTRQEMALFRKLIWGISSGRKDKWKFPVIGVPKQAEVKFVRFHESSKEMEDFAWWSTLLSIFCAFAGMDPEALSMASQKNTIGKQRLFSKMQEEGYSVRSQDEGLRFFLHYFSSIINSSQIIDELTGIEGLGWKFFGLDVEDETKKSELELTRLKLDTTMNELLVEKDKKKQELMIGDINVFDLPGIANPQLQQVILQALQSAQMQNGQLGSPGGEEGPPEGNGGIEGEELNQLLATLESGEEEESETGKAKKSIDSMVEIRIKD